MTARLRTSAVYCGLLCTLFGSWLRAADTETARTYAEETPEQHAAKMQWWSTARFGMFVHWGVYSVTGGAYKGKMPTNSAEWMMNKARIPIAEYKTEYVDKFNPTEFNAKAFVRLAKEYVEPATVVMPMMSRSSGEDIASSRLIASSCPGSQSMITGRFANTSDSERQEQPCERRAHQVRQGAGGNRLL